MARMKNERLEMLARVRDERIKGQQNPQSGQQTSIIQSNGHGKVQPLSGRISKTRFKEVRAPKPKGPPRCTNSACNKSDVASEDGQLLCRNCGTVVAEQHITSSIAFGEASNGAAVVQGSYLGADQTHVRLRGPGGSRVVGGQDTREVAEYQGKQLIRSYCENLILSDNVKEMAGQVYKLALAQNFIQGREARKVAAAAVYLASRRVPDNKTMLMDLSDMLDVNVFKLGHVFTKLIDAIGINEAGLRPINAESLIFRFAERLEFGADVYRVANDACKIMQRFDRDWMVTGRRPSGLCGAALILAARMNNYRRTIREVVYLVKVDDMTIQKRLDEFKVTPSSDLTVEEFRSRGDLVETQCDPPAFNKKSGSKQKRRRKYDGTAAEDEEISDTESRTSTSTSSRTSTPTSSRENSVAVSSRRVQADRGIMPPPPIPIDPALLAASTQDSSNPDTSSSNDDTAISETVGQKRKRGRPANVALPTPSTSQVEDESRIENEISAVLADPKTQALADTAHQQSQVAAPTSPPPIQVTQLDSTSISTLTVQQDQLEHSPSPVNDSAPTTPSHTQGERTKSTSPPRETAKAEAVPPTQAQTIDELEEPSSPVLSDNDFAESNSADPKEIPDTPIIGEDEFPNDPEIDDCLLTAEEIAVKERIWVHVNGDYLRQQQAKLVKQQLEAEYGTARVIVRRKRKRARMGDMTAYGTNGESSGHRTPAEAVSAMLKLRGYSSKLNYEAIHNLYEPSPSGTKRRRTEEPGTTGEVSDENVPPPSSPQESNASSPPESSVETPRPSDPVAPAQLNLANTVGNASHFRGEDEEMSDDPEDYVTGPDGRVEGLDDLADDYGDEEGDYDEQREYEDDEYGGEEVD